MTSTTSRVVRYALVAGTTAIVFASSTSAFARGGGITGSQGAGARTGFGPPVGTEPTPAFVGSEIWPDAPIFSDGDRCTLRRKGFGSPGFVRVCE